MSISLNNHEQRIKALENKSSSSNFQLTELWSGSIIDLNINMTLTQSDSKFDLIGVLMTSGIGRCLTTILPLKYIIAYNGLIIRGRRRTVFIDRKSDTLYRLSDGEGDVSGERVTKIYGLKIYYIFRYNICEILKLISPILKF